MKEATRFSVRAVTFDDGTASVIHSSDVDGEYVLHADYARLKSEVESLKDALNKFAKTPDGVDGVKVDVSFWTKSGMRLPSSYSTFWMNTDIGTDSLTSPKRPAGGSDDTGGMDGQTDQSKRL